MPKLRFKGFTDDWEQRKLGDIVSFSKGSGYSKSDLQEDGTPIILYGRLYTKYETVISDVDTFASEKSNSVFSNGGEVIVPASGETAEDISVASVVDQPGVILGGDLNIITPPQELDSAFLAISISNGKPHSDMAKMAQGKSVVHLHNSDLAKIDLPYPSYEEQRQISQHFKSLDNLIALHQRKCDELQKVKKYMLQKMFPKKGEKVPEIRFAGFTDDWEQRKLGDIATSFDYGLNAAAKEYDGINAYIRITDIDDDSHNFISEGITSPDTDLSKADDYKVAEGDILFARTGASVGKSYIYKPSDGLMYFAGFLIRARVKPEYDAQFVFQNTLTEAYSKYIAVTSQRSGQPGVNAQEYAEYEIMCPTREEQIKIGEHFKNLDNLIALQQRKCDDLKEVKRYMLQNMFPQGK